MAGTAGADIDGGPALRRAFGRFADGLEDLRPTATAGADLVAATARSLVPIVSGALLDTIRAEDGEDGGSAVLAGSDQVPYAAPIHYGWPDRNIRAQPFLDDAATDEQDNVAAVFDDRVDDLIRKWDRDAPP